MSGQTANPLQEPVGGSLAMIITLGLIASFSGLLIVLVHEWTLPIIDANRQALIEEAIFDVVPGATRRHEFTIEDGGRSVTIHAAYDDAGELRGIAAEGAAPGYQGVIRVLYGYDPACECITGVRVVQLSETPGLGDRIVTDQRFQLNFSALDVRLDADRRELANPITVVRQGTKNAPWQIDGISGATVSVGALGRALRESNEWLLPRLSAWLDEMRTLMKSGDGDGTAPVTEAPAANDFQPVQVPSPSTPPASVPGDDE